MVVHNNKIVYPKNKETKALNKSNEIQGSMDDFQVLIQHKPMPTFKIKSYKRSYFKNSYSYDTVSYTNADKSIYENQLDFIKKLIESAGAPHTKKGLVKYLSDAFPNWVFVY